MNRESILRALAENLLTVDDWYQIIAADDALLAANYPALSRILTRDMIEELCRNGKSFSLGPKPGEFSDTPRSITKLSE